MKRPAGMIRLELEGALAYRRRYERRPTSDRWINLMRAENEAEILRLQLELDEAEGMPWREFKATLRDDDDRPSS